MLHRQATVRRKRRDATACVLFLVHSGPRSARLLRRHCQEPQHQSKKDQRADQGKQSVEGMKLKVGIPRKSISRRQHRTSFAHKDVHRSLPAFILPRLSLAGLIFSYYSHNAATLPHSNWKKATCPDPPFSRANPNARQGSQIDAVPRAGRSPDRDKAAFAGQPHRRVRWPRLRS